MKAAWLALVAGAAAICSPAAAQLSGRYVVDVHLADKTYPGTTIFGDNTDPRHPVIVEVDMAGKVLWSYEVPLKSGERAGGMEVEWVPASDTILYTTFSGVYEVDRGGRIVWSHRAPSSHDADRLANGNTLVVWGWGEDSSAPEVREVSPAGAVVWQWQAAKHLKGEKRLDPREGFSHANAAVRLANGNTLVSLRNFQMLVEVAPSGEIVWKLGNLIANPHNPEVLPNGNILLNLRGPEVIREYTPAGKVVWSYAPNPDDIFGVRHNLRLANGNTLLVASNKIVEITPQRQIVWQLRLTRVGSSDSDKASWIYKGMRIPAARQPPPADAFPAPSVTLARSGETVASPEARLREEAGRRAGGMMRQMDTDGDGRIARAEFRAHGEFKALDADGDGFITRQEAETFHLRRLTRQAETGLGR